MTEAITTKTMLTNDSGEEEAPLTCLNSYYDNSQISPFCAFVGESSLAPSSSWLSQVKTVHRDLVAELLADKRSPNTRAAYERDLRDFFEVVAGALATPALVAEFLNLERFSAISLVLKYKAHLIDKGLAEATVNRRLAAIRSLVSFARKVGKCEYSLEDIQGEKTKKYRDTRGVSATQFKKVLATCDRSSLKGKRDYALLHLLWSNALRRNEIAMLDIKHFDPDQRTLAILGKGRGSQREIITLSNGTTDALISWLNARRCLDTNAPLFCSVSRYQAGHRLTGEAIRQVVEDSCKKAGITKKMSPHRIRHGSITHALDKSGGNVRAVQRLSRHAKLETLMIYDDNRQDMQGELTELLSGDIE
jgi:integrase/recombinase XerC